MRIGEGSNPFRAFLPGGRMSQSGMFYPTSAFLVRSAHGDDAQPVGIDALDSFLLSCAKAETSLEALITRLPCSRVATIERVERLIGLGALFIRRLSSSAPVVAAEAPRDEEEHDTVRPRSASSSPAAD